MRCREAHLFHCTYLKTISKAEDQASAELLQFSGNVAKFIFDLTDGDSSLRSIPINSHIT